MRHWYNQLKKMARGSIRTDEMLKNHTTFRIGGPARLWFEPQDIDDLKAVVLFARHKKVPLKVIGGGSNVLFSDRGYEGIIICLKGRAFRQIDIEGLVVRAGAGARLADLMLKTATAELGGTEFLVGIPGTIGGATMVNAGVRIPDNGRYLDMASIIDQVKVLDSNDMVRTLNRQDLRFSYRQSNLSGFIILEVCLKLSRKPEKEIESLERRFREYRWSSQPVKALSCGCVFRNPSGDLSSGKLIELCGLKGKQIGQAQISTVHANFIINLGQATCSDVLRLMHLTQREISQRFNIKLEPEIEVIRLPHS